MLEELIKCALEVREFFHGYDPCHGGKIEEKKLHGCLLTVLKCAEVQLTVSQ
jgi:hypothetical protein